MMQPYDLNKAQVAEISININKGAKPMQQRPAKLLAADFERKT